MFDRLLPPRGRLASGGYLWALTPAGRVSFADGPIDPAAWDHAVIKHNARRTISRVELPGGALFVKVCRPATPRGWAREWLRGPKARLEFDNLNRLLALGVGALEPLAWGSRSAWPGESVLLTREARGSSTLTEVLDALLSPTARHRLARDFGEFIAAMHAAGILHPDPHPGNVLVDGAGRFRLADVHDLRPTTPPVPWAARRENLVLWNRFFQLRASRADRARFWASYSTRLPAPDFATREVEAATGVSNRRFWARRLKRPLLDNRETRRVPGGFAARDLTPGELARWLAGPDAVIEPLCPHFWKDSASATVVPLPVELDAGHVAGVMKRFNLKSWPRVAKNALRMSPARRAWMLGHNLRDRGLPTPRPLLYLARKRFGLPAVEYVLFERVPDCLELPAAITAVADERAILKIWAERLGKLVAAMHDKEVMHRDLKAANILMRGVTDPATATPVLVDLVGVAAGKPVPNAIRHRDLARLAASFARDLTVTNAMRLTLLRTYLGPRRGEWKSWWRELALRVRAKEKQNARRGRVLA